MAAFDLIVPVASAVAIAERLTKAGKQFSAAWVGEDAQNILRIEAGIPRYGVDFNEDNLLLEVGIDHAVSFTKGCYLGQEVVERIRSRGHVNKRLCGLLLDSTVAADAGDQLQVDGKDAGRITSSVISPRLGRPIALGYVMKEYWEAGTKLSLRHSGANIHATVVKLPFPASP